jgi:hypothetical protein
MHVRARPRFEPWDDWDNPWLEYEARKAELREVYIERRATGTDSAVANDTGLQPLTPREYEAAIVALCEELRL